MDGQYDSVVAELHTEEQLWSDRGHCGTPFLGKFRRRGSDCALMCRGRGGGGGGGEELNGALQEVSADTAEEKGEQKFSLQVDLVGV